MKELLFQKQFRFSVFLLILFLSQAATANAYENVVPDMASDVTPLLIGASVPELTLRNVDGDPFDLNVAIEDQPTVLIFYRGGWCPFCSTQLMDLQDIQSQVLDLGYQILAISPDLPENLQLSQTEHALSYTLLSDSTMEASMAFGIAFRVDDSLIERYTEYGIDLNAASGESHHMLPVPSVFIIGSDGLIGFTYVNPDYKVRIDGDVLLAAAEAVLEVDLSD